MAAVCGATSATHRRSLDAGGIALAQASVPLAHESIFELEELLFVQSPHGKGLKGGIHVLWTPQPIQNRANEKEAASASGCLRQFILGNQAVRQQISLLRRGQPVANLCRGRGAILRI